MSWAGARASLAEKGVQGRGEGPGAPLLLLVSCRVRRGALNFRQIISLSRCFLRKSQGAVIFAGRLKEHRVSRLNVPFASAALSFLNMDKRHTHSYTHTHTLTHIAQIPNFGPASELTSKREIFTIFSFHSKFCGSAQSPNSDHTRKFSKSDVCSVWF